MLWTRRRSWQMGLGAVMAVGLVIAVAAAHHEPDVTVITMDPLVVRQGARSGAIAPSTAQPGAEPTCTTPQPIGTWSCQNGVWVAGLAPPSGPNGTGPGNCITPSPGAGWSCQNGTWVSSSSEGGGGRGNATNPDTNSTTPAATPGTALPCPPPAPAPGWTCQNGTWTAPVTTPLPTAPSTGSAGSVGSAGSIP